MKWSPVGLLTLAFSPLAGADVILVAQDGSGDFTDIQDAVDQAMDGDAILVRAGSYAGFVVQDKELSIGPFLRFGTPVVEGVRIVDLGVNRQVVITGLEIRAFLTPGLEVEGCAGSVRVDDCIVATGGSLAGSRISDSSDVIFRGCELEGGSGFGNVSTAGDGLQLNDGNVALYQCVCRGAEGAFEDFMLGGNGARVLSGFLFATGTSFVGGDGSSSHAAGAAANGGTGLVTTPGLSQVEVLDCAFTAGQGGCDTCLFNPFCCFTGNDGLPSSGPFTTLQGSDRTLTPGFTVGYEQETVPIEVRGEIGSTVILILSRNPGFAFFPMRQGVLAIAAPILFSAIPLGTIPAGGVLNSQFVLPPLPGILLPSFPVLGQGYLITPNNGIVFGSPLTITTLDCTSSPDCNANGMADVCEIQAGMIPDTDANFVPDACQDCNANGILDSVDVASGTSNDVNGNGNPDECETNVRLYVDASQTGPADGASWASAYPDLWSALRILYFVHPFSAEIWVARGTYLQPSNMEPYLLRENWTVYGGFAGTEVSIDQRDIAANPTILSGDLNGDDLPGFVNYDENALSIIAEGSGSALDGLTLMADRYEVVLRAENRQFSLSHCTFVANATQCVWVDGELRVDHCRFENNRSGRPITASGPLRVVSSVFVGNWANSNFNFDGGAIETDGTQGVRSIENSVFVGNIASFGGAIKSLGSSPLSITNCTFYANRATGNQGAAIRSLFFGPTLANCIFWENLAAGVAGEDEQLWLPASPTTVVSHCIVQGLANFAGTGNLGSDPLFVDPLGLDGVAGTFDDDLRLMIASPAIDSGRNAWLPADVLDLDGDGNTVEQIPFDLDGNVRRIDVPSIPDTGLGNPPLVDRGAYERP